MKACPFSRPVTRRYARAAARAGVATLVWACAAAAAGGEPSSIQSYYYFVHWMSVGHPDLALQQFTDDAVVVAGPACTASAPCVGKQAIRTRYFDAVQTGRVALPVYDQRFDGWQLRTLGEQIAQDEPLLRREYVFEFRGGRIASLKSAPDADGPAAAALFGRIPVKP